MRRAKIVCTLGPAVGSYEKIKALVDAGMDVARFNLSHGTQAEHAQRYQAVRRVAAETGRGIGVLVDLQGPKIRLGRFAGGPVQLKPGDQFVITTDQVSGDQSRCSTTYPGLPGDVAVGDRLLVDDGRVVLEAVAVDDRQVTTRVVEGTELSDNKGINLPGVAVSVPAMSEKDVADLRWALRLGADLVALSFVRSPTDAAGVRQIMSEEGIRVPVLAKIEKPQAVDNLDEIVATFDGIMIARGDLGVELPLERVPLVQKRAVDLARRNAKPVIVATQMLESMMSATRPTRAEVSDVANAVLDRADALMLSGETSIGDYPVLTTSTMARIIETVESETLTTLGPAQAAPRTKGGAIARAAAEVGDNLGARYVVAFTTTGDTVRRLARYRSPVPLLAFTPDEQVRNQLSLTWGVEAFLVPEVEHTDQMVMQVERELLGLGRCVEGDVVVIVAGSPPGIPGSTNAMRVHIMGDAAAGVAPAYRDGGS
ncbi:MAG: pyruvate kinase [Sporichthyaceae bacterium]|nr:pyruvate kinase [Sporichthyaceae bacterium]